MIDLSSAFAEFEFKLKITTMGMVTAEIPVKADCSTEAQGSHAFSYGADSK